MAHIFQDDFLLIDNKRPLLGFEIYKSPSVFVGESGQSDLIVDIAGSKGQREAAPLLEIPNIGRRLGTRSYIPTPLIHYH